MRTRSPPMFAWTARSRQHYPFVIPPLPASSAVGVQETSNAGKRKSSKEKSTGQVVQAIPARRSSHAGKAKDAKSITPAIQGQRPPPGQSVVVPTDAGKKRSSQKGVKIKTPTTGKKTVFKPFPDNWLTAWIRGKSTVVPAS